MRVQMGASDRGGDNPLWELITRNGRTVFQLSLAVTVLLYGYLLYGLLTGQLGSVASMTVAEQTRVSGLVGNLSTGINFTIFVLLLSGAVCYWEETAAAGAFLLVSALLCFGFQFGLEYFFASSAAKYTAGAASQAAMGEIYFSGLMFGVGGGLLMTRNIAARVLDSRRGKDLTAVTIGKDAVREKPLRSPVPALANCWQLPFCKKTVREHCPIYHARTKCWKQRVGCMCEDNIMRLTTAKAMDAAVANPIGVGSGFIPIGDLITSTSAADRQSMPTRVGPRGVKIPHNPNLTDFQKRERCRNCAIYNEHERAKYQLLAPIITIACPLYVALNFDPLRARLADMMTGLDKVGGALAFNAHAPSIGTTIAKNVSGSLPVETVILVSATLIVLTLALRTLEYCVFEIKI